MSLFCSVVTKTQETPDELRVELLILETSNVNRDE
jgi:hypothetical protein